MKFHSTHYKQINKPLSTSSSSSSSALTSSRKHISNALGGGLILGKHPLNTHNYPCNYTSHNKSYPKTNAITHLYTKANCKTNHNTITKNSTKTDLLNTSSSTNNNLRSNLKGKTNDRAVSNATPLSSSPRRPSSTTPIHSQSSNKHGGGCGSSIRKGLVVLTAFKGPARSNSLSNCNHRLQQQQPNTGNTHHNTMQFEELVTGYKTKSRDTSFNVSFRTTGNCSQEALQTSTTPATTPTPPPPTILHRRSTKRVNGSTKTIDNHRSELYNSSSSNHESFARNALNLSPKTIRSSNFDATLTDCGRIDVADRFYGNWSNKPAAPYYYCGPTTINSMALESKKRDAQSDIGVQQSRKRIPPILPLTHKILHTKSKKAQQQQLHLENGLNGDSSINANLQLDACYPFMSYGAGTGGGYQPLYPLQTAHSDLFLASGHNSKTRYNQHHNNNNNSNTNHNGNNKTHNLDSKLDSKHLSQLIGKRRLLAGRGTNKTATAPFHIFGSQSAILDNHPHQVSSSSNTLNCSFARHDVHGTGSGDNIVDLDDIRFGSMTRQHGNLYAEQGGNSKHFQTAANARQKPIVQQPTSIMSNPALNGHGGLYPTKGPLMLKHHSQVTDFNTTTDTTTKTTTITNTNAINTTTIIQTPTKAIRTASANHNNNSGDLITVSTS